MEVAVIITWVGMLLASVFNTPSTTVVLGDNGKKNNAIIVETKAGSVLIDKAGGYVSIRSQNEKPSDVKNMSKEEIDTRFKSAIASAPLKPLHVLLYFKSGSNELTDISKDKLPQILRDIQERAPCDVNVIGHADTMGSKEYNIKLSLKRAQSVKEWINSKGVNVTNFKVESYGETNLLVKTGDNISEEKNRRVELLIR